MRVGDLTRPKPVNVTVLLDEGETVQITFDRNRVTPAWVADAEARDEAQDARSLPKALAEVILEWDVTEDDGSPFPATAENLSVFSYPVQAELLRQILTAAVPSRAEGNASPAPTSTPPSGSTPQPETPQNGQGTSPLPALSASPSPP